MMKKLFVTGLIGCTLLAGCEKAANTMPKEQESVSTVEQEKEVVNQAPKNEEVATEVQESEEVVNEEQEKTEEVAKVETKEEQPTKKIQGSPIQQQVDSRYIFPMKTVEGDTYTLHVFAKHEEYMVQEEAWAGASEGDQLYSGTYQLALQADSPTLYLQEAQIGEFQFNVSQKSGFVSKGSPDFFVALQRESSNFSSGKVFYIYKGKVMEVHIKDSEEGMGVFGTAFQALDNGKFMMAAYNNAEGIWHFTTYQVDFETGYAAEVDTRSLSFEEGEMYLQENFQ
ncbi:hypothetical protein [Bacillus manliponensis]|nr:hypothetical protein [Bacillus manliponensis]